MGEGKSEAEAHDSKLRSDLLFQNGTSNQMNGKSEPSLKIGRELSRQLNIDPAVVLECEKWLVEPVILDNKRLEIAIPQMVLIC